MTFQLKFEFCAAVAMLEATIRRKIQNLGSVVVYHFEIVDPRTGTHTRSKRPAIRTVIEALGAEPLMDTAQVVEQAVLDRSGFLASDDRPR